ncbi:MAG TPA: SAM-dependent methyltransferase, partial [Paracoccaceae bacterium]|nr:SAM-dependent methyltransferase [Paracoccaceae bacterium]
LAIDVGHSQIHPRLADDPRVTVMERTNARHLDPATLPMLDWVVSDVSFISATLALGPALNAARPGARLVTLIKPQFESDRSEIGKGGIVRDAAVRARAVTRVADFLAAQGWQVTGTCDSPITGSDGNAEFLAAAVKPGA